MLKCAREGLNEIREWFSPPAAKVSIPKKSSVPSMNQSFTITIVILTLVDDPASVTAELLRARSKSTDARTHITPSY